jgi:hypothetical protein
MVRDLLPYLPETLVPGGCHVRVLSELVIGGEKPDVVVAFWHEDLALPVRPLSVKESALLAMLRVHGATRIDLLEERCMLARGALRGRVLSRLVEESLLQRGNGGLVALASEWASRVSAIAIEAKLARWRRAFMQAASYTRYANQAYVAMPDLPGARSNWQDMFAPAGVGFLCVKPGSVQVQLEPNEFVSYDWRREYMLSRVVSRGASKQCPNYST